LTQIAVRTPQRRYMIKSEVPDWEQTLRYLACDPQIDGPEPEDIVLDIVKAGPFLQMREAGQAGQNFASVADVREHLHGRFLTESLAGSRPVLHAACLIYQGRRVLLAAPKNAGKSTLSLALALAGFAIEGDENIFVEPAAVMARPRACRVKEGTLSQLPALAPLAANAAFVTDYHGRKIYNLPPDLFGQPWRIARGPAHAVIVLHANHGGMSSIRPVPPLRATQALMAEAAFAREGRGAAIAVIAGLARQASIYELSVGDLPVAVACVKSVLAG